MQAAGGQVVSDLSTQIGVLVAESANANFVTAEPLTCVPERCAVTSQVAVLTITIPPPQLAPLSAEWLALAGFAAEYYQRPLGEVAGFRGGGKGECKEQGGK